MNALPHLPAVLNADGTQVAQGPAATAQGCAARAAGPAGVAPRHKGAPAHPAGFIFPAIAAGVILIAGAIMIAPTQAHAADVQLPMLEAYEEAPTELPATGSDPRVTYVIAAGASALTLGTLASLAAIAGTQPRYRRTVNRGR